MLLELAQTHGLQPKRVAGTQGGEYHCPCPTCAGTDRFQLQPHFSGKRCKGRWFCRQCQKGGDTIAFLIEFMGYKASDAITHVTGCSDTFELRNAHQEPKNTVFVPDDVVMPSGLWESMAHDLVRKCINNLADRPGVKSGLLERGIPRDRLYEFGLGWVADELFDLPENWGVEQDPLAPPRKIWIPKGLLIPTYLAGRVIRLKVRRYDWKAGDKLPKYVAIRGSATGMSVFGDPEEGKVLVVVESELDAIAVLSCGLHKRLFCVAIGGSSKNPDRYVHDLASRHPILFACDNDAAGIKSFHKWKGLYPNAMRHLTPFGKDIGEFVTKGGDLKQWIAKAI